MHTNRISGMMTDDHTGPQHWRLGSGFDEEDLRKQVAREIRGVRKRWGVTQIKACEIVFGGNGANMQSLWSKWERGTSFPDFASLARIAYSARVSLDRFGYEAEATPAVAEARALIDRARELLGPEGGA